MKETENQAYPRFKFWHIVVIILFIGLISAITSYITAKTIAPSPNTPISISTTLPSVQRSPTLFPFATKSAIQLQTQQIETNLLLKSGFENDLAGWTYSDNVARLYVFETTGVNGKGFVHGNIHCTALAERPWLSFFKKNGWFCARHTN